MMACQLHAPEPVASRPLVLRELADPEPRGDEVVVRVRACGICRTDLHIVEGELPVRRSPLVPGHQVVGTIESRGTRALRFEIGQRVGVAWLHRTCGACTFCASGRENLCDAPEFTGWTVDGGYAERVVAPEAFVYALPDGFADLAAAPLLCAGIIGYRCLKVAAPGAGARLGLFGFGAAAHVAIQIARHRGIEVFAVTRGESHRRLALELGAVWAGERAEDIPHPLDAAIVFAPSGEIVPPALRALSKGGTVVLGGIHMSPIPSLPYELLYQERVVRSVANNTRSDGDEFLRLAAEVPVHTETQRFPLSAANDALLALSRSEVRGAAVLEVA